MTEVKINSLTDFCVEQIKIIGALKIGNKIVDGTFNKTLDAGIISCLPNELISQLVLFVFGADFTIDELTKLNADISVIIDERKQQLQETNEYEN